MYRSPGNGVAVAVGAGTLVYTGANGTGWVMFGVVLVLAGVLAVFAGRRRRRHVAVADEH
jgi:LPXTG-motif cell wall-anchored protein